MMQNEKTITFDKLPEAVGYLTEQVIELKKMVSELKPRMPAALSTRQKPRFIHWYGKAYCQLTKKARNSTSTRMNSWHGSKTDGRKLRSRTMTKFWPICKVEYAASPSHVQTSNLSDNGKEND